MEATATHFLTDFDSGEDPGCKAMSVCNSWTFPYQHSCFRYRKVTSLCLTAQSSLPTSLQHAHIDWYPWRCHPTVRSPRGLLAWLPAATAPLVPGPRGPSPR